MAFEREARGLLSSCGISSSINTISIFTPHFALMCESMRCKTNIALGLNPLYILNIYHKTKEHPISEVVRFSAESPRELLAVPRFPE